ncbi:MAG: ATP-dependent DNA helicase [Pseudomonadaceae bacterium]|nr:ATP-dependent DNA helicase [Pseudomonadaceae bacterium]
MIRGDLSVRALAEFTCRAGDLYPPRQGRAVDADEGITAQRDLQKLRKASDPNYQQEVAVELVFQTLLGARKLRGRIDGLTAEAGTVVEEIKCRGALPDQVDPVDYAQALIYAGMLALRDDDADQIFKVRVVYVHVDTRETAEFTQTLEGVQAAGRLQFMVLCLVCRLQRHFERNLKRLEWAAALQFPMHRFRAAQQTVARRVYQALAKGENLLLEAPTGSGKSLAVLFPAAKAQQLEEQLFFLTSRNAGASAALTACRQIDPGSAHWVVVELTAKAKVCVSDGAPCEPENCPLAKGYYDRVNPAVDALLEHRFADRTTIQQVAQVHQVCPFELALDVALWADVIVGDYNYVFDPVVRLKRFAEHRQLHLLVDESHQLSPRVSDMLTVRFPRALVREAKSTAHAIMKKKVLSIDRALLALKRAFGEGEHVLCGGHVQPQAEAEKRLDSLQRACTRLLEAVAEHEIELPSDPSLRELVFAASRWLRSEQWVSEAEFVHVLNAGSSEIEVSRVCLDPGPYLEGVFAGHGAAVRFSGTVTPLPLYQRLHGQSNAVAERAQTPFQAAQTEVVVVRDISTYFNQRDLSLPKLVKFLVDLLTAKKGRYLVALPSFTYLNKLISALATTDIVTLAQSPGQNQTRSDELLDQLRALDAGIICIVMGGVLAESVDFSGISLQGVVLVGLGLPPPSLERDLMAQFFEQAEGPGWGQMVAYTQPALVKNLQAAGRLIRSPSDFGVICLVDPRFSAPHVQRFFPVHWHPRIIAAADVQQHVKQFWQTTADHKESDLQ